MGIMWRHPQLPEDTLAGFVRLAFRESHVNNLGQRIKQLWVQSEHLLERYQCLVLLVVLAIA